MSVGGRQFTDDTLNRVLDHWLSDGPTAMPEDSLNAALRAVAATPQRRWRGRLALIIGASPVVPVGLTVATIAAIVALGIGIARLVPPPGNVATPTPDASDPPSGMVVYTNERDGYELTLPASWTPAEFFSHPPGTMRFGRAHSDGDPSSFGALTVSIGSPDGTVYACAPSLCRPIVATTIDELDAAIENDSIAVETPMIYTTDVDVFLDGVPARLEYVTFRGGLIEQGAQFHHVFAIHDGRPVVLSFDKYAYGPGRESNNIEWVESLIQSFEFLDTATPLPTGASPSPTAMRTYVFSEAGFAVDVPADWQSRRTADPGIVTVSGSQGGVTVRTSNPNGEIPTCLGLAQCEPVAAGSIDDLINIVRGEYRVQWGTATISSESVRLDGAVATRVTVSPPRGTTGPGTSRYVFVIRDGRSVILEWTPVLTGIGLWNEILASLRFIDSSGQPGSQLVTGPGFEISVPASWSVITLGTGRIEIVGPNQVMNIHAGDANGRLVDRCQDRRASITPFNRYWESCDDVVITTFDGFARLFIAPSIVTADLKRPEFLAGEETRRTRISGYDYVFAFHEGRPYVVWHRITGSFQPSAPRPPTFNELLAAFTFIDVSEE